MPGVRAALLQAVAASSLIALIFLCLAWELWLAPLRPGGSALVLKTLPLLAPLRGILHGRLYTYRWASLLIWLYFAEGTMRALTEATPARSLAIGEIVLSLVFFVSVAGFVRRTNSQAD
ncbi:MAG: DUF2069 domain-containing protein [Hydrogenophilales bacterium]|jgi:uncharacterized membrane protein|nr:DUF2069 domain-containing protein [Hydrogenophilales bacterium]